MTALTTFFRAAISASTISLERAGAKRQSVVNDTTRKSLCARFKRGNEVVVEIARRIEMVECARHQQIGVCIEALRERTALMVQIALYLKLHVACSREVA